MGVGEAAIDSIMSGIENTGGVKQHNHKKKLRQRFDIIKKLGQGTFGKVQLGINKETGQEVAIKTIKKSKIESDADLIRIRREIQIMSSVQHPNIIHIYEVFENREKMVLVMEYAAGGELYDYLSERKVLQEEEARRIFRQIATASYYCHKHKICHRDLKLENILLDENNNAKIADFGLSNVFDDQRLLNTFCGSPLYASPEIVKGTPYHGPEVDCWSLGVLLYTLVYGAMPFDGSNFKRLVKQISQGDYYEPAKPSPASPLIRDMLTVNPRNRADIEKICSHWWVNETYDVNCLDISEELANQTPVRLDVLLSLAPPAPQLESEKLVVTSDASEVLPTEAGGGPARSQSVGSLMELTTPEKRIMDLINSSPKRKLESTVSTDRVNLDKRKDKIVKENTVADISVHRQEEDSSMSEALPLNKSLTQTISKQMDIEPIVEGAACQEIMEEVREKENAAAKKSASISKIKRTQSSISGKVLEGINEIPSQENLIDKENKAQSPPKEEEPVKKPKEKPTTIKTKSVKKKILADKNEIVDKETKIEDKEVEKVQPKENGSSNIPVQEKSPKSEAPSKPVERRKSRIFEAAEKFQNLISPTEPKPNPLDKPKKILIPDSMVTQQGVSVDGYKKEFERKSSLTSSVPVKPKTNVAPKRTLIDKQKSEEEKVEAPAEQKVDSKLKKEEVKFEEETPKTEDSRQEKVKNAVNIISNALDIEGTRKSKSRPCMMKKPPVPFGVIIRDSFTNSGNPKVSGRSASGNIGTITPLSPPIQNTGPKPFVRPCYENKPVIAEAKQVKEEPTVPVSDEPQTSSAEITLKSATLPRRKTTKAQIQINYPTQKPAQMEFRTEAAHNVEVPSKTPDDSSRSSKERIIPIAFEKVKENGKDAAVQSPPAKPPVPRPFQTQKSTVSQRSNSLSRQSTQDSDSETASIGEPIKKSPREYIIPIAVEGGGYVTPRAGSLEPSDTASNSTMTSNRSKTKFGLGARRLNSLFSDRDSEDESPFATLHRHSSFGKDSDNEDSKKDNFPHMHRLRRIRPKKATLEHNDSVSSGEEDDDEGFEILTAENLFSTLLSRVRDLTQRLNVDDSVRPGFPSSRLLSTFDHGTNFWNRMDHPMTRHSSLNRPFGRSTTVQSSTPWRRSVSKDLASDIESVFNDQNNGTLTARVPRGEDHTDNNSENLNLANLDLKKLNLSEEDQLALSYLTPGLSRRIQKQLLAQLTPSEVRKLQRTLSSKTSDEVQKRPEVDRRRSVDRMHYGTLPRKSFLEKDVDNKNYSKSASKSFLPVKFGNETEFNIRSSSIGAEPKGNYKFSYVKPKLSRSVSTNNRAESKIATPISPESSISESISRNDTDSSRLYSRYSSDNNSYSRFSNSSQSLLSPTSTDLPKIKPTTRRVSRFLRPDFFENKEENVLIKEKKERERETQQVLKEIRDKRKSRLRSQSRSREEKKEEAIEEQTTISHEPIKAHDYVNIPAPVNDEVSTSSSEPSKPFHDYVNVKAPKKESRISRIARPKSYPNENIQKTEAAPLKESKISKLKKGFGGKKDKPSKEDKNETNEEEKAHKNKLLQSIEKKLEKFRSNNIASKDPEEAKALLEKKSIVDNAIKRLREQSLPRNLEPCTESGLLKRAVSVEDLAVGSKPLQASRKSVTKILGLFKKYEEQPAKKTKEKKPKTEKKERPKSLLLDKMKHFQNSYNGAKSDSLLDQSSSKSKLPVNRRSLNLDNINEPAAKDEETNNKPDRTHLRLDFTTIESNRNSLATDDSSTILSPTEDYLSCDSWSACSDYHHLNDLHSPQSHHLNGNHSAYSGDENESVIDRIRRKSFYTRFNEKRRPARKANLDLYSSLDRYRSPSVTRRVTSYIPEHGSASEYRPYVRSASVLNDYVNVPGQNLTHSYQNIPGSSYQNLPGSYQTYTSRIARPKSVTKNLYSDSDCHLDDVLTSAIPRRHSPYTHRSALESGSLSPIGQHQYFNGRASSVLHSPTTSEPL